MARRAGWSLFAGAAALSGIAFVFCLGRPGAVPALVLAATAGGAGVAARASARAPSPLGEAARTAAEVEKVARQGYDIRYRRYSPSRRFVCCAFLAVRDGREVGRLDVHVLAPGGRLFAQNVFVEETHRGRGVAAALLVSAVVSAGCTIVTTSGRTADGAAFCVGMRPVLARRGVELRDGPF